MKILKKEKSNNFTVDIEVENTHSYQLSNGIVTHNTVSQLVDSASGIHDRFAEFFIRTVRADVKDPVTQFMKEAGFPVEPDVTKPENTAVFSFPMQSPKGAVTRHDRTALQQLNHWMIYQDYWCEHKPSITVYVRENEWMEVGAWCWEHFDKISGISFLPYTEHVYRQAPYQDITKEEYEEWVEKMPKEVDWMKLSTFESEDRTIGSQELSCSGSSDACEIVDLVSQ